MEKSANTKNIPKKNSKIEPLTFSPLMKSLMNFSWRKFVKGSYTKKNIYYYFKTWIAGFGKEFGREFGQEFGREFGIPYEFLWLLKKLFKNIWYPL